MKEFQRNLNAVIVHNSNNDLGSNSNSNILHTVVIDPCMYSKTSCDVLIQTESCIYT